MHRRKNDFYNFVRPEDSAY